MAHGLPYRRQFLKAAAQALTFPLIVPDDARINYGPNEKVSVAFIGVGRLGSRNIAYAARLPGFQIAAVCDVCQPALERAKEQCRRLGIDGVRAETDFRKILADRSIDAVCIATPARWRPYIMMEACRAGKDVYLETPAFVDIDAGPEMVEAARKYRRVVQAGNIERSGAAFQKAREIVKSGDLGDITFCRGFLKDWGNGVHLIDTVQFVFDEAMPASVTAQAARDTMLVTYRYAGFIGSYESRSASLRPVYRGTAIHGDQGTLMVKREGNGHSVAVAAPNGEVRASGQHFNEVPGMHVAHWENFLKCIRTRARPIGDIETCVRTTATWVLASLAVRHNVRLDWDDRAFTVKQDGIEPYLKFKSPSPWKLEV